MSIERWELIESPSRYHDYYWWSDAAPARKLYRFLAEVGRRLRPQMTDPGPVRMIDLCEQCAEGRLTEDELADLAEEHRADAAGGSYAADAANTLYFWVADRYKVNAEGMDYALDVPAVLTAAAAGLLSPEATYDEVQPVREHPIFAAARHRTELEWGALVRDIYGPDPFRPVTLDPRWRTADAVGMARGVYEDRAFDRLPLLADALMDAGCTDEAILTHCRLDGPHVHGCWVVDLVLGTE